MIWLPGVLSQGGKKFTWGRYSLKSAVVESTKSTYNIGTGYASAYCSGYTFNESTGLFTLTGYTLGSTDDYASMSVGTVLYAKDSRNNLFYSNALKDLSTIYRWTISKIETSGSNTTIHFDIVKLEKGALKGEYIDTVEDSNGSAYPENGKQGDYWYVRYSDTPITWERYAVSQTAVEGSSTSATGVYNKYLKVGTEYSIENGEFAVKTTQSLRIRSSTSSITAPYTILANGTLSLQSGTQTTGDTVRGPMLGKLTRISGSSSNMYADFIPYTIGTSKGSYIDTVESFVPDEYPDDGIQDGYWYVKIS